PRRLHRGRGLVLVVVVVDHEIDLGTVNTAGLVEIVHRQLDALQRTLPDRRLIAGEWSFGGDLNLGRRVGVSPAGRCSASRQRYAGHSGENKNPWLCHPPCRPPLPSLKT